MDNFLPSEVVPCSPNDRDAVYELDPEGNAYANIYALRTVLTVRVVFCLCFIFSLDRRKVDERGVIFFRPYYSLLYGRTNTQS